MANEKQKPGHVIWKVCIVFGSSAFSAQHCSLPAVDLAFPSSAAYRCDFLRQKRQQR